MNFIVQLYAMDVVIPAELSDLVVRAQELKGTNEQDANLAVQLRRAANAHYGPNNRSPEFRDVLGLARVIDGKARWETTITLVEKGSCDAPVDGYVQLGRYAAGAVDLFKDGAQVHRMYGLVLELQIVPGYYLKTRIAPMMPLDNMSRGKHIRARDLLGFLKKEISSSNETFDLVFLPTQPLGVYTIRYFPDGGGNMCLDFEPGAIKPQLVNARTVLAEYVARRNDRAEALSGSGYSAQ